MTNSGKALLVEDLPDVRAFMCGVLGQAFEGISVDEAGDLASARRLLAGAEDYGIALVDLGLPDGSGVDLVAELRRERANALVVVTTIYDDDEHLFGALSAGADGYLLKEQSAQSLLGHLLRLGDGIPAISPAIARRMLRHFREGPPSPAFDTTPAYALTPRETDVLSLIGRGLRVGEVATVLGLTDNTVAGYVKVIYRKLDITSRAEAAIEASRRGLI